MRAFTLFVFLTSPALAAGSASADVIPFFGGSHGDDDDDDDMDDDPRREAPPLTHDSCAPKTMKDGSSCGRDGGKGLCRWVVDAPGPPSDAVDVRSDARCSKDNRCLMCVDARTVTDMPKRLVKAKKALADGKPKLAFEALDGTFGVSHAQECQRLFHLARAVAGVGRIERALELNGETEDYVDEGSCPTERETTYNRACYQALGRDPKAARDTLFELVRILANGSAEAKVWKHYAGLVAKDKDLAALRKEPWFAKLKARFEEGAKDAAGRRKPRAK